LVSPQRGTTRDYLAATISINEMKFELLDTAGTDQSVCGRQELAVQSAKSYESAVDESAQSLAFEQRERATIRAYCVEASLATGETQLLKPMHEVGAGDCDILVLTKADILPPLFFSEGATEMSVLITSSRTGQGLDELCAAIHKRLKSDDSTEHGSVIGATADRCRESVRSAATSLKRAADLVLAGAGNELVAVELRGALDEIGRVVGAVYADDILDRIFGTFCIGK
jgi:tRNA modification GTPase